jgi:hypothetical protein
MRTFAVHHCHNAPASETPSDVATKMTRAPFLIEGALLNAVEEPLRPARDLAMKLVGCFGQPGFNEIMEREGGENEVRCFVNSASYGIAINLCVE